MIIKPLKTLEQLQAIESTLVDLFNNPHADAQMCLSVHNKLTQIRKRIKDDGKE